jgi:hypothetical protein
MSLHRDALCRQNLILQRKHTGGGFINLARERE